MKDINKVQVRYLYRHEWKVKYVTLSQIAEWTRSGKYQGRVDAARGLRETPMEGGMVCGPMAADELPMVMPARGAEASYTGLVLLSLWVDEGVEALEQLRRTVNLWEQTVLSFVGATGRSLEVVVAYRLTGGGLPAEETQVALFQQYAYKRAADFAYASTGYKPAEVAHDGSEYFRISYDEQVYYHPEAKPIEMVQPTEPLTEASARMVSRSAEVRLDTEVLPGYTRREMDATKYNFICRELANGKEQDKETYLMKLATACCKAGIDKELAIKETIAMGLFFKKDILVRSTFNVAYEKHPLGRKNPVERSLMHQQLLEEFLRRRYMFRRNSVTGDLEYQEKHRYALWWKPLTEEARNDINNAAIEEGIKVWPQDMDRLIGSSQVNDYDPVREWLRDLPEWDGRDRLGEMADRVPTLLPNWRDNFKVWMRSMVSQWTSGAEQMYGAQMVMMFVGAQGTRKSTFMRMLLPEELRQFYIDRIDFANKKEALHALSRFLLINIDEFDQISKSQTAYLKHLIQRTDVKERKMYETTYQQLQRYAAFVATTNSLSPLKDETGSRRYMVVEVTGVIDTSTEDDKAIDYKQMYAQAIAEIRRGEDCYCEGERERLITEKGAEYYEMPNVVSIFCDHFRKPVAGSETEQMTPTEILAYIHDKWHINLVNQSNAVMLGNYLRREGYERGKGNDRRRYKLSVYCQS